MRKISLWAKHHRFAAILIIIISKILLAIIAYYSGIALLENNIQIPGIVLIIDLVILAIAFILYPSARITGLSKEQFYIRQKSCDFILAAGTFILIATMTNINTTVPFTNSAVASTVVINNNPKAEEILASLKYRDKSSLTKKEKRILKKEFKNQLSVFVKAKITGDKAQADKSWLIVLTIIGALGLFLLIAALACNIGCSGSETGAAAVAIIGTGLLVWGTVALIKRIQRGPKARETEPEPISQ